MERGLNTALDIKTLDTSNFKNDSNRSLFKTTFEKISPQDITVITHGNIFHADEILAIAILSIVHSSDRLLLIRMHRKNLAELEKSNELCYNDIEAIAKEYTTDNNPRFIVDCGKVYNNSWAFDHHQNKDLEAASSLVARRFFNADFMEYHREFFDRISSIDCDKSKIEGMERTTEFNNLIRNLNAGTDEGFALAISMSTGILKGMIHEFIQYKITGDSYYEMIRAGNVRYSDELIETFKWQKYAEKEGVKAIITRDRNNDSQFVLMSRDTKEYVIPEGHDCIFRHNSGFLAIYSRMEDAMNAVNGGRI